MAAPFWYIIANPAAGNGAVKRRWPELEGLLQELGISYSVQFTTARGTAGRLVEDALLKGGRHILGIGGDGTNHEIANGILQQRVAASQDVWYALLPVGTGNDWARQYGIPHDARRRLQRLLDLKSVLQDAGLVQYEGTEGRQSRYFVNVAGMAYDAFIVRQLLDKPMRSSAGYLLQVARLLFQYEPDFARLFPDDENEISGEFYTINIGICRYSGGGMQLVPHAVPDDGLLALTAVRRISKPAVLLQTPRFYNGTILQHPKAIGRQVKTLRVEHPAGAAPVLVEADGEFLGATPVEFSIVEQVLRIVL